jgi:hypothetical protein
MARTSVHHRRGRRAPYASTVIARRARPAPLWLDDEHVVVGDVSLTVVDWGAHFRGEAPAPLDLRKTRDLIEAYTDVLPEPAAAGAAGPVVVELGLHTSGSAAYLLAALPDATVVTVDVSPDPVPELADLAARLDAGSRLHVLQPLDQTDPRLGDRIDEVVGSAPLDLVIDDASHRAAPTVASFEVLFPRLAPGGRYVIEDWAQAVPWAQALLDALGGADAHRVAEIEAGLAGVFATGASPMARASLVPWVSTALADPMLAHHTLVRAWWDDLGDRTDPAARTIVEQLGGPGDEPALVALAAELIAAPITRPDLVGAVRLTRHWIEIERGPASLDPTTFRWRDVAGDPLGVLRR